MKFLLDMDIGDDIDDAIALYAAMCRGLEIVGVTTVFRNTCDRARQVKRLMAEFGNGYEQVPVYAGHATPMGREPKALSHIPHYTPDLEEARYTPDGVEAEDAVDFILHSCRTYGKDLTLIAIGPFTNVARAIQRDAEALNSIAGVLIMGGAFYKQYADWNVICDVKAADLMFRSLTNLECIGADVTHLMVAEEALCQNLFHYQGREGAHLYLTQLCRIWQTHHPGVAPVLHDPLVIYYAVDPSLCEMRAASVAVVTEGYAAGMTLNVDAYGKKHYFPEAYGGFDADHKVLVAASVQREVFHRQILADFDR